jgi:hypothetical protein
MLDSRYWLDIEPIPPLLSGEGPRGEVLDQKQYQTQIPQLIADKNKLNIYNCLQLPK